MRRLLVALIFIVLCVLCSCNRYSLSNMNNTSGMETNSIQNENSYTTYDATSKTVTVHGVGEIYYGCLSEYLDEKPENLVIGDGITKIADGGFTDLGIKNIVISDTVTNIGEKAFLSSSVVEIDLPANISKIEDKTFMWCASLEQVNFPDNLKVIGKSAFYDCDFLQKIELPSNLKKVKENAFYGCNNLSDVILPNGITSIEDGAFLNCPKLKGIVIPISVKAIGKNALGMYEDPDGWYTEPVKDFTIKGYKGTVAQQYARENGFNFVALDE